MSKRTRTETAPLNMDPKAQNTCSYKHMYMYIGYTQCTCNLQIYLVCKRIKAESTGGSYWYGESRTYMYRYSKSHITHLYLSLHESSMQNTCCSYTFEINHTDQFHCLSIERQNSRVCCSQQKGESFENFTVN